MHINATFLIQIINFIITYYVLNRFLFRPIIASLKRKHDNKTALTTSIEKEETNIIALEKEKYEAVISFQRNMKKKFPYISPIIEDKPVEVVSDVEVKIDTKALQKEVANFLIEKVPHAY